APGHFPERFVGELDQSRVEQDRLDAPDPLPFDLDVLLSCELLRGTFRLVEHGPQLGRVEMTLVEEALCGLDDGRDDAGPGDDAAHRADGALAGPLGDLPDLELQPRGAG